MIVNVTVCELRNDPDGLARDWAALVAHVRSAASDLVLLPEMPFAPWFAAAPLFDQATWAAAVAAHETWLTRLVGMAPASVISSCPVEVGGRRLNQAFVWEPDGGYRSVHNKYYLPDDPGFWEARWYERGDGDFSPVRWRAALVGVQICTELWFLHRARSYGQAGVHLLAIPRATGKPTRDKWLTGGRTAAVVSGAYTFSSNLASDDPEVDLGGQGWVVGPDGDVLTVTSRQRPFATVAVDLTAERAKMTYPRYVAD